MSEDCNKGYQTDCCCNCTNRVTIHCHPSNGGINEDGSSRGHSETKGSMNKFFGWGCIVWMKLKEKGFEDAVIFSDNKHGMCEMHHRKTNKQTL